MIRYTYLLLIVVIIGFASCKPEREPCGQPTIMSLVAKSHKVTGLDTLLKPIVIDTALPLPRQLAFSQAGTLDSFTYTQPTPSLIFHLSSVDDTCMWLVQADTSATARANIDTMIFYYQRQLSFLSNACGYTYFYNLQRVTITHHTFDSVQIANASVTNNVNTEHVKIFMH